MSLEIKNFQDSFKYLRPDVKSKAVGITSSLMKIGLDNPIAELIAISNAKLWACFMSNETIGAKSPNVHLIPHPKGWALISEDASSVYFITSSKKEALIKARGIAKNEKLKLYIHSPVGNIHDSESFAVNRPLACGPEVHSIPVEEVSEKNEVLIENNREVRRDSRWVSRNTQNRSNSNAHKGDSEKIK